MEASSSAYEISSVVARQIFDSRGNPTIQVDLRTMFGLFRASVPSGASTGKYEALQLRDHDQQKYHGKSVFQAVQNVNKIIAPALVGMDCREQEMIDKLMVESLDGSQNEYGWSKAKLGANSILAVSLAIAKAGAKSSKLQLYEYLRKLSNPKVTSELYILPCPAFNLINGGKHGGNGLAMQEFMIFPTGAQSFSQAMRIGTEVYHHLKVLIKSKYGLGAINVGDEGGFAPTINSGKQALDLLVEALKISGHQDLVEIGMDCAASEFYQESTKLYDLHFKDEEKSKGQRHVSSKELCDLYKQYVQEYPICSIEDPFDQDDTEGWGLITQELESRVQIVGDDLLVTNRQRIAKSIEAKHCNALLLKVNQIGSLTEAIEAANLSKHHGWGTMVSHRSGETEDTFIADLVVGLGTGQIKTGAPCRSERLAKYNQLLRIEEQLGEKGVFAGKRFKFPYGLVE